MKKIYFISLLLIFSLFANAAFVVNILNTKQDSSQSPNTSYNKQYPYISKAIFVEQKNDVIINFTPLRESLKSYTSSQENRIGIYFEYLPSGTSIGINEKEVFFQASLIKVPMAMAIYQLVSKGKINMDDALTLKKEDIDNKFGDLWQKGAGYTLSIEDCVDIMLKKSDNTAYRTLFRVYPTYLDEIFDFLDIPKESQEEEPIVTPKNYSSILKSLYLSSYLEPKFSNEILEILTQTEFSDRLVAGVDKNIKVAHKVGIVREKNIYSDCGIVYFPNRPYILCVMVEGEREKAIDDMANVSKIIFNYIKEHREN